VLYCNREEAEHRTANLTRELEEREGKLQEKLEEAEARVEAAVLEGEEAGARLAKEVDQVVDHSRKEIASWKVLRRALITCRFFASDGVPAC
jgi:chromosome segregation ATPase